MIPPEEVAAVSTLEEMDLFESSANRVLILEREGGKCFYCLRALDSSNYVIEHVASRPAGDNSYRNVVAACLGCNNKRATHWWTIFFEVYIEWDTSVNTISSVVLRRYVF